jgi:hypothetical protein
MGTERPCLKKDIREGVLSVQRFWIKCELREKCTVMKTGRKTVNTERIKEIQKTERNTSEVN